MGGFAIETNDAGEDPYIPRSPRLHLTANGAAVLSELGLLPRITRDSIRDKSKADHVAKFLVIIQASWLILQCIARTAGHLPLSLLEINTLAHVACALIMYVLWWDKPFDVHDPIVLVGEWKRPVVAAMWMLGEKTSVKAGRASWTKPPELEGLLHYLPFRAGSPPSQEVYLDNPQPVFEEMTMEAQPPTLSSNILARRLRHLPVNLSSPLQVFGTRPPDRRDPVEIRDNTFVYASNPAQPVSKVTLERDEVLFPFGFGPKSTSVRFERRNVSRSKVPRYITPAVLTGVDRMTLTRWELACQSLQDHEDIWSRYRKRLPGTIYRDSTIYAVYEYPDSELSLCYLQKQISNWPDESLIPHKNWFTSIIFFSICVLVYAGIHAAAWNEYFPTDMERWIWRVSAIYIGCSGLLLIVMFVCQQLMSLFAKIVTYRDMDDDCNKGRWFCCCFDCILALIGVTLTMVPYFMIVAVVIMYFVTRTYLVVEGFYSLRDLPVEVYATPNWTQYLVHF